MEHHAAIERLAPHPRHRHRPAASLHRVRRGPGKVVPPLKDHRSPIRRGKRCLQQQTFERLIRITQPGSASVPRDFQPVIPTDTGWKARGTLPPLRRRNGVASRIAMSPLGVALHQPHHFIHPVARAANFHGRPFLHAQGHRVFPFARDEEERVVELLLLADLKVVCHK